MTKKEFMKKYSKEIAEVATAYNCDLFEAADRIKYEARVRAGRIEREDTYTMPEDLEFTQVIEDMDNIVD